MLWVSQIISNSRCEIGHISLLLFNSRVIPTFLEKNIYVCQYYWNLDFKRIPRNRRQSGETDSETRAKKCIAQRTSGDPFRGNERFSGELLQNSQTVRIRRW